jgi:hypothetical protein
MFRCCYFDALRACYVWLYYGFLRILRCSLCALISELVFYQKKGGFIIFSSLCVRRLSRFFLLFSFYFYFFKECGSFYYNEDEVQSRLVVETCACVVCSTRICYSLECSVYSWANVDVNHRLLCISVLFRFFEFVEFAPFTVFFYSYVHGLILCDSLICSLNHYNFYVCDFLEFVLACGCFLYTSHFFSTVYIIEVSAFYLDRHCVFGLFDYYVLRLMM